MTEEPTFTFPSLPPPHPPVARQHCRYYSYKGGLTDGGPRCAVGIDLTAPGAGKCCWPDPEVHCEKRKEWTEAERTATKEHMARMMVIMPAIPGSADRKAKDNMWGRDGSLPCPGCGIGTVRWSRARTNGHLWASCTTPNCFSIIQ